MTDKALELRDGDVRRGCRTDSRGYGIMVNRHSTHPASSLRLLQHAAVRPGGLEVACVRFSHGRTGVSRLAQTVTFASSGAVVVNSRPKRLRHPPLGRDAAAAELPPAQLVGGEHVGRPRPGDAPREGACRRRSPVSVTNSDISSSTTCPAEPCACATASGSSAPGLSAQWPVAHSPPGARVPSLP